MSLKLNYQLMNADEVRGTLERLADEILVGQCRPAGRPAWHSAARCSDGAAHGEAHWRTGPDNHRSRNSRHQSLSRRSDEVAFQPVVRRTEVPPDIDDKDVILVDDVLYTGRTVGAALGALIDFGRMRTIQLAVLVDRGHRELPIEANFIGKKIATKDNEVVEVRLTEIDGEDAIYVMEKA